MKIRPAIAILVSLAVVIVQPACGDEIAHVAAFACDEDLGRFSLMADVDADDASAGVCAFDDEHDVHRITSGTEELRCSWDGGHLNQRQYLGPGSGAV